MHIKEPLKENNLLSNIKSFETISDSVSEKVREQYLGEGKYNRRAKVWSG